MRTPSAVCCLALAAVAATSAAPIQCTPASERPNWPTYHFFNNVTLTADRGRVMEPLNDANAVFEYKGLYHVMLQAGGGNWTHGIAVSPAGPWFTLADALSRETKSDVP